MPAPTAGCIPFYEQGVKVAAFQISDDEAARLRSGLDASFAVNLLRFLRGGCDG